MTIGELARKAGIRTSAIRYYESIGLLKPARVNGRRHFGQEAASRLTLIATAKGASFSLDEIRKILEGNRPNWREAASRKLIELEKAISRATSQREAVGRLLVCSCETISECAAKTAVAQAEDRPAG